MNMNVWTFTGHPTHIPQGRLWFGACGGAAAWALHGFTCFLISAQACKDGTGYLGPLSPPAVRTLLAVITLAYLTVAITAGWVSWSNWRRLTEHRELIHDEAPAREEFMALVGVFVNSVFVIGIIWAGLPLIWLNVCVSAR